MTDMTLLHHWTVSTSVEISQANGPRNVHQTVVPLVGFEQPFVLSVILALAALHKAHLEPQRRRYYVDLAAKHYEESLAGFRIAVQVFTRDKSEGMVAWSLLNVFYVLCMATELANDLDKNSPSLRRNRLLGVEWIPMMRGIDAILAPHFHEIIENGRLGPLMQLGNWRDLEPPTEALPSDPIDQHLVSLAGIWRDDQGDAATYDDSLRTLRRCRMYSRQFETMDAATLESWGCNRDMSGPMVFIHLAPQKYFDLLDQRQPPALVLFAHFGAMLHGVNHLWFFEGWGSGIVGVVDELLGNYWRPWIRWPLECTGMG